MRLCISISLLFFITFSSGQNISNVDTETALQNMIFKDYNRYRKPVVDFTTNVPFGMVVSVLSIENVDEKSQTFSSAVWLAYRWKDEYLRWNTSEYGIKYIRVPAEKIWVPSICNIYELAGTKCLTYGSVEENEAFIDNSGIVFLHDTVKSTIPCQINLQKYPFDEHRCTFQFVSLISDMHQLEVNKNFSRVDTAHAIHNGEWSVESTEMKIRDITNKNNQSVDHFLDFTIIIRRRPTMAVITVILPITLLSVINIFCFVLPIEEGEKIGMSMAIFLTFAVYATLLSETMPSAADNISWFNAYVTTQVVLSALTIILQTIVLRVHYRDPQTNDVSDPQTDQRQRDVNDPPTDQRESDVEVKRDHDHDPVVESEGLTTIKTRSNTDFASNLEIIFMVCAICINIVSICVLFANVL